MSLDREGKTAIERQEAECRGWAEHNGLTVREVHVDRGRSGYKDVAREGFKAARSAVVSGAVRTLIVWRLDRLSRKGNGRGRSPSGRVRVCRRTADLRHGWAGLEQSGRPDRHGVLVGMGT
ncbi:recombinase family protein [Streptomyces sp. NPDC001652]|uniref:recombinase family protein n=1 Tax=Streptomyces sp. NPDC001652 TaxID=3154393 RepID=UPI0033295AE6